MTNIVRFPTREVRTKGLTSKQQQALVFIQAHMAKNNGVWPTFAQIGASVGIQSKMGVVRTVSALFELNAIQRPGGDT